MEKSQLVTIRDGKEEDRNFIFSTWLRGLRYGNDWFEAINSTDYYAYYHRNLEVILNLPGVVVKVACLKDDPEVILGYSVYRHISAKDVTALDWVFVKSAWRGIGIAKQLVPSNATVTTHLTKVGKSILREKYPNVHFNPFLF